MTAQQEARKLVEDAANLITMGGKNFGPQKEWEAAVQIILDKTKLCELIIQRNTLHAWEQGEKPPRK